MNIRILWVGKTKERFVKDAIERYSKQAAHFCTMELIEIKDERGTDLPRIQEMEGKRILKATSDFVLLHNEGKEFTSIQFAGLLEKKSSWDFVVGGPYGVSDEVRQSARTLLSLSKMTFPHDLVRIMLLEQIYRALTIHQKRGYHH
ncbi:MAG: 23S rRNA (pseudouridine(1915)-N(3))-methyltransferase RlmH [bacterium]